ncbi:LysE family translocator [Leifsonia virtsii]|uniref:LysE family translocator n=1 Tax=Leifsonia virtsii TaxID=3035915 RepID=A0ABT8IZE2_9MICO|nr:LysE family translocator [Leifsonia virtsii]MDN4598072.1 LysE family translocator [Leifsonia virtsii]
MTVLSLLAFAGLCLVLALTPGPDTFLVLRYSMGRARDGIAAAAGTAIGSLVWAALVGVGLAALLEQSAEVFRIVKIAGGLYLIYLGVAAFLASRKSSHAAADPTAATAAQVARRRSTPSLLAGLLSTMLNPKVGLFFIAVVPQFVSAHAGFGETMLLGAIDGLIGMLYLVAVALLASRMIAWLRRPRVTRALERISAGVLSALGIGTVIAGAEG